MSKRYTVSLYENEKLKRSISNLDKYQAYEQGIPEEALAKYPTNKWHYIVRSRALITLELLEKDEYIIISYLEGEKDNTPLSKYIVTAM
jgi:hypothetical protein